MEEDNYVPCNLLNIKYLYYFYILNCCWDNIIVTLLSLWNNNKVAMIYCCKTGIMVYVLQMCSVTSYPNYVSTVSTVTFAVTIN